MLGSLQLAAIMLLGCELLQTSLASTLVSFVINQTELLVLLLQHCAEYRFLTRFKTAMVDEISLLLALHLRRMLANIFAHLTGWSLTMVALYDVRD